MKKFLALTISLSVLTAGLMVPFSRASRNAYHNYLTKKIATEQSFRRYNEQQPTSGLKGLFAKKRVQKNDKKILLGRFYLNSRENFSQNVNKEVNLNLKKRTMSKRIFSQKFNQKKTYRRPIVSKLVVVPQKIAKKTYENELFSVEIPKMTTIVAEENKSLEAKIPFSTIQISAKKSPVVCHNNFTTCAHALAMSLDREQDIYRVSKTVQYLQPTDSVLGEIKLDKKKYLEGFISTNQGKNTFVARLIIQGENEEIYIVEIKSAEREIDKNITIAKGLFQSFRVKNQQ